MPDPHLHINCDALHYPLITNFPTCFLPAPYLHLLIHTYYTVGFFEGVIFHKLALCATPYGTELIIAISSSQTLPFLLNMQVKH